MTGNIRRAPEARACENFFQSPPPMPSVTSVTSSNPFQSCQHPGTSIQGPRSRPPESEILILGGSNPAQQGGTGCHRMPQAATGCHRMPQAAKHPGSRTSQIHRKPWKSMKIYVNPCKSLQIHVSPFKSMQIYVNL